jgi:hypothetical protein
MKMKYGKYTTENNAVIKKANEYNKDTYEESILGSNLRIEYHQDRINFWLCVQNIIKNKFNKLK